MGGDKVTLTIYTSALRKIFKQDYFVTVLNRYTVDVSKLSSGTYPVLIEIYAGNNRVFRQVKPITVIK